MPLAPPRLLLLLSLVVASGCTPRLVHRLDTPDPDVGVWREGRHARTVQADGMEAEVSYVRTTRRDHVLWVRVTNLSADTVLVDPARFMETAYAFVHEAEARDSLGRPHPARDPEAELLDVDLTGSRRDARARTQQTLGALSAGFTTVAVLTDPPETPDQEATVADAYLSAEVTVADAVIERQTAADAQISGRDYWEGVLRRTTLPPNTYIDGLVHVPIDPIARAVVVDVVVGETEIPFLFLQRNVRP